MERGGKVLRQEIRARKADRDSQGMPPVPGKDISPYDGRPASWWRESAGKDGGRRAERERVRAEGGGQVGLGQGLEGDCGSGGAVAGGGSNAAVEVGCDIQADGTRSVPATSNEKGRGWDSVVVEESDILACGGYLPEKYIGGDGEVEIAAGGTDEVSNPETGSLDLEQAGPCEIGMNAGGASPVEPDEPGEVDSGERTEEVGDEAGHGSTPVVGERPTNPAGGGTSPTTGEECETKKAPNEPNSCDDGCTVQHQYTIEVAANSGGVLGLDGCQTNPIFLEAKPIPAVGPEAGGTGDSTRAEGRPLTEHERREAWKESRRREWIRSRAEKQARERERIARLNAGVPNNGSISSTSGEAGPPHDVRGP